MDEFSTLSWFTPLALLLSSAAIATTLLCRVRAERQHSSPPLEFKLLRGPGESSRRQLSEMDESMLRKFFLATTVPWFFPWVYFLVGIQLLPENGTSLLLFAGILFVILLAAACWWMSTLVAKRRSQHLDYLGKRAVGEQLEDLKPSGYHVFHDLEMEVGGKNILLDHLVVGETGLFMIETRTRRKGRTREGFNAHEVSYDGHSLIWPWGEDSFGLDHAAKNAAAFATGIRKRTGLHVEPRPVLALPGWSIVQRAMGNVMVLSEKSLHFAITGPALDTALAPEQINLIVAQLEALCPEVND